jgi:hypothetical protein
MERFRATVMPWRTQFHGDYRSKFADRVMSNLGGNQAGNARPDAWCPRSARAFTLPFASHASNSSQLEHDSTGFTIAVGRAVKAPTTLLERIRVSIQQSESGRPVRDDRSGRLALAGTRLYAKLAEENAFTPR